MASSTIPKLLTVVMDGVGHSEQVFGNAVLAANTPNLDFLAKQYGCTLLNAHGPFVGLPSLKDMGNSEVGHNALGGGRVVDQGIGLLSDGNVHSHENHLHALIRQAAAEGVRNIFVHVLLDGRDVPAKSAEVYAERLENCLAEVRQAGVRAHVASGGGRMVTTMDRYNADWSIVERGWKAHVRGLAEHRFAGLAEAIAFFRKNPDYNDQNIPPFILSKEDDSKAPFINDGDSVVFFNFRGDRAVQISRAFTEASFSDFDRVHVPKVFFAGMMQYDGDLNIPENYLVSPPVIDTCLSEILIKNKIRQFACSETQKFGHVTFFWNGNRSGYIDEAYETYKEVQSHLGGFEKNPAMKAKEITDATILALESNQFDFGRINYANGDMVGHTGDFAATVLAVEAVDTEIGRLWDACRKHGCILVVTADHGNADDMFQDAYDQSNAAHRRWSPNSHLLGNLRPKTSHSLNPVPFLWCDSSSTSAKFASEQGRVSGGIGQFASSVLKYFDIQAPSFYAEPL